MLISISIVAQCSTLFTVTVWMGDCLLLTGKPSWYIPNHLGQLSRLCLWGRLIDSSTSLSGWGWACSVLCQRDVFCRAEQKTFSDTSCQPNMSQ